VRASLERNIANGSDSTPYTNQQVGITGIVPQETQPPVMVLVDQNGQTSAPDWSCYDTDGGFLMPLDLDGGDGGDAVVDMDASDAAIPPDAAPDAGMDAGTGDGGTGPTAKFALTDFVSLAPVGNVTVQLFYDNDATHNPDFTGMTADMSAGNGTPTHAGFGEFFFPLGSTQTLAYRIPPSMLEKELVWYDNRTPLAGQTYQGQSITNTSYNLLINGILGTGSADPNKMNVVVGVRDCNFKDVSGGIVQLIDDTTGMPLPTGNGPTDMRTSYFLGSVPDTRCTHTTAPNSLYSGLNVPTDRSVTARAFGRKSASDAAPVLLGERKIPVHKNAIVIVRPYRIWPNGH